MSPPRKKKVEEPGAAICFRCGDVVMYCTCVAEYSDLSEKFIAQEGREPTFDEMQVLQPQTELERKHFERKKRGDTPKGKTKK